MLVKALIDIVVWNCDILLCHVLRLTKLWISLNLWLNLHWILCCSHRLILVLHVMRLDLINLLCLRYGTRVLLLNIIIVLLLLLWNVHYLLSIELSLYSLRWFYYLLLDLCLHKLRCIWSLVYNFLIVCKRITHHMLLLRLINLVSHILLLLRRVFIVNRISLLSRLS